MLYNTLAVPCEKSRIVSFASSIIKNIVVVSPFQSNFPLKLICCITLEPASGDVFLNQ